eukprot:Skav204968  [mRNA]  locus=scaffold3085:14032:18552:- [translate_table: standard]
MMKYAAWAGYKVKWQQVHDMSDFAPYHRKRWLACLIRKDLCSDTCSAFIDIIDKKPTKWSEPMYKFSTPPSLHEQRVITAELEATYANPQLLPKAKQEGVPFDAKPFQVLQSRVVKPWDVLPTLVASYSSQHMLPSKNIWETGVYAELTIDDFQRAVFQCPIMWASLLGICRKLFLPNSFHAIFKVLGNCITVAHATMVIAVMLHECSSPVDQLPKDIVWAIWEKRLTAFNAVCIEFQDGFLITDFEDYMNNLWIPNPVAHVEEVAVDVVLTLPNRHTVRIQCIKGMSVIAMLKMRGVPPHLEHLWAIKDTLSQAMICQYDTIQSSINGFLVFLPFINRQERCAPTPEWTQEPVTDGDATDQQRPEPQSEDQVPVPATVIDCDANQTPTVVGTNHDFELVAIKVIMTNNEALNQTNSQAGEKITREIECLPIRTIGEAIILAGHSQNLESIEVTCDGVEIDIDELVTTVHQRTIAVNPKKKQTPQPKQRIIEVIRIDGTTSFFQLNENLSVRDLLMIAGLPEKLIAMIRIEVNGKLTPFTTKIGALDIPCIRLRTFPLKGGGGKATGKGKGSDPMQTNDPWAQPPMAPSKSATRWDQLLLLDDHPFFDAESDTRLSQLPFVKIGPEQSGVAFATKTMLNQASAGLPKGTTVVLLPGFKGVTGDHIPAGFQVMPPQQIIVMEPTTRVQYKRLVVPVLIKGQVDFKVKEAPGMVAVQSSKYVEIVAELNDNLISQTVKTHLNENPLDCFRRFIAQTGQPMEDVAVYSYHMVKMHDLTWTHQCIVKVPQTALDKLLTISGSNELYTRKFLAQDELCDHSILPRYWQPVPEEIRIARQLGETLGQEFRGLAYTNKGVAIRVTNSAISTGRAVVLQSDNRFTEDNRAESIEVTCDGVEIDIDELVTTVHQRTIAVNPKKKQTPQPKQRIIEVIRIDGTTSFFQLNENLSVRDLLMIAGLPEKLIAMIRIEVNGKLTPFTTKIGALDIPCIRLRTFPLKGGGGKATGKGKGSDPMQTNDPWAQPPMAPSKSATRWDQLLLLDDHPFFDAESDTRLSQLPFVKIGPEQSGVAFATKTMLNQASASLPKGTTVVLLPGFKGVTGDHIPAGFQVMPPQQIIVMEPTTRVQYKRLVVPVLVKGQVDFKVKEAPGMVAVQSSKYVEIVAELNDNLISQTVKTHLNENPLDCFRRFIAQTGQPMEDVAVYSYRMVKMHDLTWTHQCIVKVPQTALDKLLTISGSNELYTRKFLAQDELCDHSILPRYWQPVPEEIRIARQLGETLGQEFRGLAYTNKGVAIRVTNSAISTGRAVVLQSDNRFTEDNRAIVCNHYYLAQGFRFDMSHTAIIKATMQALQCTPVPMRSFRIGGMITWVLAFQTPPTKMIFSVKVDNEVCEVVLTPQPANPHKTKHAKKIIKQNGARPAKPSAGAPSTTIAVSAANASNDEKRLQALEARVGSLETRQEELTTKVDSGFSHVSAQLQQLLAAVVPQSEQPKNKASTGTGETPPPKYQKGTN